MAVIIVSGSVCTGKTTLAKQLAEKLGFRYVDVNKIISKHKLSEGYDGKYHSRIIDEKKLSKALISLIKSDKKSLIIDSHLSHYLPNMYVDLCIITKCSLKILKKRLMKRYPKLPSKVTINMEAEIFDTCFIEACETGHSVLKVDTTHKVNIVSLAKKITRYVK